MSKIRQQSSELSEPVDTSPRLSASTLASTTSLHAKCGVRASSCCNRVRSGVDSSGYVCMYGYVYSCYH